jgi:hypothetical protein
MSRMFGQKTEVAVLILLTEQAKSLTRDAAAADDDDDDQFFA